MNPSRPIDANAAIITATGVGDFFQLSPLPMWVYGVDRLNLLAVNTATLEHYGFNERELRERGLEILHPPDEWIRLKPRLQAPSHDPAETTPVRHQWKDGTIRHVETRSQRMHYGGENACLIVAVDVTQKHAAELDLRSREAQLSILFDHAMVGLAQVSLDGRCLRANQTLLQLLRRSHQQLQGHGMVACFHPDDRPTDPNWLQPLQCGTTTQMQFEKRLLRDDGSHFWARISLNRLPAGEGSPGMMLALIEDLTAQRQDRAALAASEARYREMVESASEGVWQVDANFRTTFVNRRMAEILGMERQEMMGRSTHDFMDEDGRKLAAEYEARRISGLKDAHDFRFHTPAGREVWALISSSPSISPDGRFQGAVALVTDITERKRMEKAIQVSEARFREIAATIEEVFWMADVSIGKSLYVSPAYERIWGRSLASLQENPRSFIDAIHPDDRENVQAKLIHQRTGEPFTVEYRVIRPDGTCRWVYDRGYPVKDAVGQVTHYVGACTDITERRILEMAEHQRRLQLEAIAADAPLPGILAQLVTNLSERWPEAHAGLFQAETSEGDSTVVALSPKAAPWATQMLSVLNGPTRQHLDAHPPEQVLTADRFNELPGPMAALNSNFAAGWFTARHFHTKPNGGYWLVLWGTGPQPETAALNARLRVKIQLLRLAITRHQTLTDLQQLATSLEQRVAEQTEQVRRQAHAMDATVDGLSILENETYVYMNPAHATVYGYTVGDLLGKSWTTLYSDSEIQRLRNTVFPILLSVRHWSGETLGRRKDGTTFSSDISLTLTQEGYIVCACRDNSQRHQQTEAIRRSQEQLSLVLSSTNDGFWDWSIPTGAVIYSNRLQEMLGYRPGELPGTFKSWFDRIHPDDRERVLAVTEALRTGTLESFDREYRLRRQDGQWLWVHDRGKVVAYDAQGHPIRAVGTHSDITLRREAEGALQRRTAELIELNAELARAAQGRDEFLARVSHELRTPLTSILALTEMLTDPQLNSLPERSLRQIRSIHDSSLHLLQLINEILDLAKLEAGQFRLNITACDAAQVAQESIRLINPQATRRQLHLKFEPGPQGLHVLADPLRLKQMLVNLLGNAIKFTPAHGHVQLEISQPEPGRIQFRVNDTGIGISPEKLGTLFRPFVQLESGLNHATNGSGLGLVIVKHFAELQRGSISATSAPGYGSCFFLQLPEATGRPAPVPTKPAGTDQWTSLTFGPPAGAPAPLPPINVLLVDDNELNRESLGEYLTSAGFVVFPVPDGATALRELPQLHPDVIIMDVQMPGLDGLEVTRRMRQLPDLTLAQIPILGLTAMAMPDDRARCLAAGMTAYQVKPFPLKLLPDVLRRLARPARGTPPPSEQITQV